MGHDPISSVVGFLSEEVSSLKSFARPMGDRIDEGERETSFHRKVEGWGMPRQGGLNGWLLGCSD
jgi:hypothetical protein